MPTDSPETIALLRQVRGRQRQLAFIRTTASCTLVIAGLYAAFLVAARLLALLPDVFTPVSLLIIPALGGLLALLLTPRSEDAHAARAVDSAGGHKDLFLSTVLANAESADYVGLLQQEAESHASNANPKRIVPIQFAGELRKLGLSAVALLLAVAFLPQLDPFGQAEDRDQAEKQRTRLKEATQATILRKEVLKKENPEAENSKAVDQELADLKKTLNNLKPKEMKKNQKLLSESQKGLGQMWRKLSEEKLKKAFDDMGAQQFGSGDIEQRKRWKRSLKKGDASELKEEMRALRKEAEKLMKMEDGEKKDQARKEMSRRLQSLKKFLENEAGSKPLNEAMQRALEQLAMAQSSQSSSKSSQIAKDALASMQQSLELSEAELESLAQAMRDMESLEKALQTLQQAKKANSMCQGVDGSQCSGMGALADYESFYNSLMAGAKPGQGTGAGMKGAGSGKGGLAGEDDKGDTDFVHEKTKVAVTKGKMLLEWKMRELSKPGDASKDYAAGIQDVKQGVSEAILQEQVPPGYHESVRGYFDALE
ncbi:MAG: hypothetical protein ACI8W8_000405 [Rhodothermales bacterium]|jgi:hypothetical protein